MVYDIAVALAISVWHLKDYNSEIAEYISVARPHVIAICRRRIFGSAIDAKPVSLILFDVCGVVPLSVAVRYTHGPNALQVIV